MIQDISVRPPHSCIQVGICAQTHAYYNIKNEDKLTRGRTTFISQPFTEIPMLSNFEVGLLTLCGMDTFYVTKVTVLFFIYMLNR